MQKSRGDLNRLQVSSGDQGLNRGVLASIEDTKSVLEMKGGIRKGSQGGRRAQSALQSQERAVGHEGGLGRHDDGSRGVLRVKEREKAALGHNAKLKKVSQQCTDVLRG